MGFPAAWSFMDQKTHFLFVWESPQIISLTIFLPDLGWIVDVVSSLFQHWTDEKKDILLTWLA